MELFKFDASGNNVDNHVPNETHAVSAATARVIVARAGTFYTESVVVRLASTGAILVLGVDYRFTGFDPEMTAYTGLEVSAGIEFINESIFGDVVVTYQAVGGHEGTNSYILLELTDRLEAMSGTTIPFSAIIDPPTGYPPAPHEHSVLTDLTELDSLRNLIEKLTIAFSSSKVLPGSRQEIMDRIDRIVALVGKQRQDINTLSLLNNRLSGVDATVLTLSQSVATLTDAINYIDTEGNVDLTAVLGRLTTNEYNIVTSSQNIQEIVETIGEIETVLESLDPVSLNNLLSGVNNSISALGVPRQPQLVGSALDQLIYNTTPVLSTSDFLPGLPDTHASSSYQIATDSEFTNVIYSKQNINDLTSHLVLDPLSLDTDYYARASHTGVDTGESLYSPVVKLRVAVPETLITVESTTGTESYSSVLTDRGGNTLVVGTSDFNTAGDHVIIRKLDLNMDVVGSVEINGVSNIVVTDAIETSLGDYVLIGYTDSLGPAGWNGWVLKLTKQLGYAGGYVLGGSGDDYLHAVAQGPDSNIYIVGDTNSVGPGGVSGYIVKLDANLGIIGERSIGLTGNDHLRALDFNTAGDVIVVGRTDSVGVGSNDGWVTVLDASLGIIKSATLGGVSGELLTDVVVDAGGNIVVVGESIDTGVSRGYVAKLDSNLVVVNDTWSLIGTGFTYRSIDITDNGDYVLVGDSLDGNYSIAIAKYDSNLNRLSTHILGGTANDLVKAVNISGSITTLCGNTRNIDGGQDALLMSLATDVPITVGVLPVIPNISIATSTPTDGIHNYVSTDQTFTIANEIQSHITFQPVLIDSDPTIIQSDY